MTYNEETIKIELEQLQDWHFKENAIEKHFQFKDFTQTLGFIVQVGVNAEKRIIILNYLMYTIK